jgi:hypothetical protein
MARKRMIDPNFWRDEKVGSLSYIERLVFIGLWNFADDNGVGRASPSLLKCDILPYDNTETPTKMQNHLNALATAGLIQLYAVDGQNYYFIKNFGKYQKVSNPTPSNLPLPDASGATAWIDTGTQPKAQTKAKVEEPTKQDFGEFKNVKLTMIEYNKLVVRFGETKAKTAIEELGAYMKSKGKRYTDHYATLLNWVKRSMAKAGQTGGIDYDEE